MRLVKINESAKLITGGPYAWDGEHPPEGYVSEEWALTNGYRYTPPAPEPVPDAVPAWALQLILDERGKLNQLQAAIDNLTGPTGRRIQWIFRRGDMFDRDGDAVNDLGASIGYTPAQVDDLFRDANQLANS